MKIRELLKDFKKSEQFKEIYFSICEIAEKEFNLFIPWVEQDRLESYFYGMWYCTDTYVGYRIYFFDNEPVAISHQSARKAAEDFYWVTTESFIKVKEYLKTFVEEDTPRFELCNLDEEIGNTYKINYHCQLFDHHLTNCLCHGVPVTIIEKHKGENHTINGYEPSIVKIKYPDGNEMWIDMKELDFPYIL